MTTKEQETFDKIFNILKEAFPEKDLGIRDKFVYIRDTPVYNTDGYNLLYCLFKLIYFLKEVF